MNTPGNQGRDIAPVLDGPAEPILDDLAVVLWAEVRAHPGGTSTCECPVIEVLARLYELGYTIEKNEEK